MNNYRYNDCPIVTGAQEVCTHAFNDVSLFRGLGWLTEWDNSNQLQHEAQWVCTWTGRGGWCYTVGIRPFRKVPTELHHPELQAKRSGAEAVNYMSSRSFKIPRQCCLCGFKLLLYNFNCKLSYPVAQSVCTVAQFLWRQGKTNIVPRHKSSASYPAF